jgi:hypothetical protein
LGHSIAERPILSVISRERIVCVLVVVLAGCASVGGSPAPESTWQTLANQATEAMSVGPVYIDERPGTRSTYDCREMRIELGAKRSDVRLPLAHELAHRNASLVSVHDACAELRDLLSRYPGTADSRKPGECGAS